MIGAEWIFISDLVAIFAIYLIINTSLNLEFGYTGIPNFGKVLAVAGGAFVMGVLPLHMYNALLGAQLSPVDDNLELISQINAHIATNPEIGFMVFGLTLVVAMVVGAGLGLVSAYPAIRLRGDYLAITLLAFGELIRIIGINTKDLVGGTLGVTTPDFLSFVPNDLRFIIASIILLVLAGIVFFLVVKFTKSPVGRLMRATRDDEVALQSLGRDTTRIKIKVLMLSGLIAAVGGVLYASYVEGVVAFGYNRLNWTFLPFVMVIVGGMANNKGMLLGTVIFVVSRKLVIFYNDSLDGLVPFDIIWLDYLLLGGIMLIILLFRPRGILPENPKS